MGMFLDSFLLPLNGSGVRYGLSVSRTIEDNGIFLTTLDSLLFLKVRTPPIPSLYPNFIYCLMYLLLHL